MLKIPRFGSFRTIAAVMSLFQNAGGYLKMTILLRQMGYYTVPIWDLQVPILCALEGVPKAPKSLRNGRNGEVLSRVADDQGFLMVAQLDSWDLWSTYSYDGYPPAMHLYGTEFEIICEFLW